MDIWSSQKAYSEAPKRPTLKLSNDLNSNLLNDRFGACKRVNSELANNALIIIVRFSGTPPYPPPFTLTLQALHVQFLCPSSIDMYQSPRRRRYTQSAGVVVVDVVVDQISYFCRRGSREELFRAGSSPPNFMRPHFLYINTTFATSLQ